MPANERSGPIPGENFTSDTKNYPWHRPPEITDLDKAIEYSFKKIMSKNTSVAVLTMMEMGVNIATITDMFVTGAIGAGKWTPDYALLVAGPVAHILYLLAKGYGLDPDLGINDDIEVPTKAFFNEVKRISEKKATKAALGIDVETVKDQASSMSQEPVPLDEGAEEVQEAVAPKKPMTGMMAMAEGGL
jgi:hypothetical protein